MISDQHLDDLGLFVLKFFDRANYGIVSHGAVGQWLGGAGSGPVASGRVGFGGGVVRQVGARRGLESSGLLRCGTAW